MYQEDKEVTLNLVDLCVYILRRWKIVIIFGFISTILVGGLMSFKEYSDIESEYNTMTYSSKLNTLTENQQNNVKNYCSRYENYKKRIKENKNYIENSFLMDIDPNNVSEYTVEYLVKTGYQDIMSSFTMSALDHEDYEKMAEILGENSNAGYVSEIVNLEGKAQQDAYEIDTDKVGDVVNGNISNSYTGILQLQIRADSRDKCEKIADIADAAIKEHLDKLNQAGIDVEIIDLVTVYIQKEDSDLSKYQTEKIEEGSEIVKEYNSFINEANSILDEEEQQVFRYFINQDQEVKNSINWKKWLLIGGVCGVTASIVIILLKYLFIPGLKTYEEIGRTVGEKEIGLIKKAENNKFFLDRLIGELANKIEYHGRTCLAEDDSIAIICNRIVLICEEKKSKEVYLINDVKEEYTKKVVDKVQSHLTELGLSVRNGNPSGSADDFKMFNISKDAIAFFVITNKASLYDSITNNIAICNESGVIIGGNFIVNSKR